ncbi:MAG: hypothetical protein P4L75_05930 [Clostridia bacterium]|nr:hypothetical protein [Clostridia bacterium]MDR3645749.1 hypothetical protein [Clostridia bacterium]
MKIWRTFGVIIAVVSVLFTAAAAISYLLSRTLRDRDDAEKSGDYIDCGQA